MTNERQKIIKFPGLPDTTSSLRRTNKASKIRLFTSPEAVLQFLATLDKDKATKNNILASLELFIYTFMSQKTGIPISELMQAMEIDETYELYTRKVIATLRAHNMTKKNVTEEEFKQIEDILQRMMEIKQQKLEKMRDDNNNPLEP